MSKHILVIGATGRSGIDFCSASLEAGHRLTLYVRSPEKLPPTIAQNAAVTVFKGTLEDKAALEAAIKSGPTVFVSVAGPVMGSKGTPVTDALKTIFPLLVENNYERALVLGTNSYVAKEDKGALKWKAVVLLIKTIARSAYLEFNGLGAYVDAQDASKLKWTLFRVPFLTNGPAKLVTATYTGWGGDGLFLSRKGIAAWILQELGPESQWVGKCPTLSN